MDPIPPYDISMIISGNDQYEIFLNSLDKKFVFVLCGFMTMPTLHILKPKMHMAIAKYISH